MKLLDQDFPVKDVPKELSETKTNYSILEKKYQDLCNDWFALQAESIQNKGPRRKWFNSKETGKYLNKSLYTLQRWRSNHIGPRWGKNGGTVIYFQDDLDTYMESTIVNNNYLCQTDNEKD